MLPWNVRLEGLHLRTDELGARAAKVCSVAGTWDNNRHVGAIPLCAKQIPNDIEAARLKETQALLKFGRDNQWPIKMSTVCAVSEHNTLSITYDIDWEGIKWEDEEVSVAWCWSKFVAKANAEQINK
jgi:hypothetical protein